MLRELGRYPVVRLLPSFVGGVVITAFLLGSPGPVWLPPLAVALISVAVLSLWWATKFDSLLMGALIHLAFAGAGATLTVLHTPHLFTGNMPMGVELPEANYLLRLTENPDQRARTFKVVAEVQGTSGSKLRGKALVYLSLDSLANTLKSGDVLVAYCRPQPVRMNGNPGEFNYPRFLRFKGIYHQAFVPTGHWKKLPGHSGLNLRNRFEHLRDHLLDIYRQAGLTDQEFAVAAALTLGHKDNLDRATINHYSGSGAMHVLAVSGLHVGMIYLILNFVVMRLVPNKKWEKHRLIALVGMLFAYAAISGLSASVLRATVMFSFVAVGRILGRHTSIYNTLAASALVLLVFSPYMVMEVGFQLSYLAVVGIVSIQPWLFNLVEVRNGLLDRVWQITCVSIAAQIITFPVGLLYFHQFPLLFMVSNLVVIPGAMLILALSFPLLLLSFNPTLLTCCGWVMKWAVRGLNYSVAWIEEVPHSVILGVDISVLQTLVIYALIFSLMALFMARQPRAVFLAGFSALFLLMFDAVETYRARHQNGLVVYSIPKHLAFTVVKGGEGHFFANTALLNDTASIDFHVRHHWWANNINRISYHNLDSLMPSTGLLAIELPRQKTLVISKGAPPSIHAAVTIAAPEKYVEAEQFDLPTTGTLIVAQTMGQNAQNRLVERAHQKQLRIHKLQTDGAYSLN